MQEPQQFSECTWEEFPVAASADGQIITNAITISNDAQRCFTDFIVFLQNEIYVVFIYMKPFLTVYSENPVDAYPNSTIGVIHFYIDDGKLIVYNPDERTSVRGDAGTATIYWTIPGQVFWSISSNISGPMVFSGSVSTTAGDYCPLNGISFDGYVSGLVDVQMMPGSNYATLEGSMLDIQGVSYVLPGVEAYMYH